MNTDPTPEVVAFITIEEGLPFGDPQVQALWSALVSFCFLPTGFRNRDLREQLGHLIGQNSDQVTPGRTTYNLRRLRLHGLIERLRKAIAAALPITACAQLYSSPEFMRASCDPVWDA